MFSPLFHNTPVSLNIEKGSLTFGRDKDTLKIVFKMILIIVLNK